MPGQQTHDLSFHDYHRTVIAYHGTTKEIANQLVNGGPFKPSSNDDDWLGSGIYFWEYAPKQAWWWAQKYKKHAGNAAVVGAIIRLGRCFDLLDPANIQVLRTVHEQLIKQWPQGTDQPQNGNQHKKLDCAVFNFLYNQMSEIEAARAVYVPTQARDRAWPRSWIYAQSHIQICVRKPENILALWRVRQDGRYGNDDV